MTKTRVRIYQGILLLSIAAVMAKVKQLPTPAKKRPERRYETSAEAVSLDSVRRWVGQPHIPRQRMCCIPYPSGIARALTHGHQSIHRQSCTRYAWRGRRGTRGGGSCLIRGLHLQLPVGVISDGGLRNWGRRLNLK